MATYFEVSVLATPEAVSELLDRLTAFLETEDVEQRVTHHVTLIIEEILTNVGTHGQSADQPVKIRLDVSPENILGEIVDRGLFFDLTEAPDPELEDDIDRRQVGGLGMFLVRKLSSRLDYDRRDGENHTRFIVARA